LLTPQRMCTQHARSDMPTYRIACTHTHTRRHARTKLKSRPYWKKFSIPQRSKKLQSERNYQGAQNQNFHNTLPPTLPQLLIGMSHCLDRYFRGLWWRDAWWMPPHQEITLVYICRIRMRIYVIKSLKDIYMSNNFELTSLRRIIFYPTNICCIDYYATYHVIQHIFLNNIWPWTTYILK